jgi:transposase
MAKRIHINDYCSLKEWQKLIKKNQNLDVRFRMLIIERVLANPKILHQKENLTILPLPSYGQELNPVERFFAEIRKVTANVVYKDINEIEQLLQNEVIQWINDKKRMKKLTYWEYIENQLLNI